MGARAPRATGGPAMAGRLVVLALLGLGGVLALRGLPFEAAPSDGASYTGWVGGLLLDLAAFWLTRLEWSVFAERLGRCAKVQRRRLAWLLLECSRSPYPRFDRPTRPSSSAECPS